jgi:hypothetical protein
MWSAFVTGMAEKATSLIDERDKEIQERIDKHLEKMQTEAAETKKKAQLRRDTLESTARELMSLGVSDVQAATLLQNVGPEGAANMVEKLKKAKQVTPEKIRLALAQVKTSAAPLDEVIAQQTTPTATKVQAPQMRGAFNLPSRAGEEFAETAKEIKTELPDIPTKAQPLDLSVLEDVDEEVVDYKTLTIKSWRPVAGSTGGAGAPAAGEQPAAPTPADIPADAEPIPRDAKGKVDKSKLIAGKKYASSTGDVRIWNGTSFQPPK